MADQDPSQVTAAHPATCCGATDLAEPHIINGLCSCTCAICTDPNDGSCTCPDCGPRCPERTPMTGTEHIAIDADPEFFSGLTLWSADQPDGYPSFAAQVRQSGVDLVFNERKDDGHVGSRFEREIPLADARRLRDLLNVATARGYL